MLDGEKNLIERAILGEASAFGLLYDRYQPQIYRFIYLKVSHREEAEDLTHQVFFQSWKKISEYNFEGFPFGSWLYRVARNEIIDYYRTRKIHYDIYKISEEGKEPKIKDPISEIIDRAIDISRIEKAIRGLKPTEQDVIILRFIEDFSPAEVGQMIDKTPEAVRVLQHRAIKRLKQVLNQQEQNA